MEIRIHNVLDSAIGSGDTTMLGVGLELPASDEVIEVAMRAAGATVSDIQSGSCVQTDASDLDELGRFAVEGGFFPEFDTLPDDLLDSLNYEQLGLRFQKEQNGVFVGSVFVANLSDESEMEFPYNGNPPLPDRHPRRIMRLFLEVSQLDNSPVYLDLPASLYDMNIAAKRLGWESLSGHSFIHCQSSIPWWDEAIIGNEDIYELVDFAEVLDSIRWQIPQRRIRLLRGSPIT